jgi:hypothetical protein
MSSIRFRLIDDEMEARDGTLVKIKRAIPCESTHPDAYDPLNDTHSVTQEYHWLNVIGQNMPHIEVIGSNPRYISRRIPVAARSRASVVNSNTDADKKGTAQVVTTAPVKPSVDGTTANNRTVSASFDEPGKKVRKYSQSNPEPDEIRYYKDKVVTVVSLKRNIDKNKYYMVIDPGNGQDVDVSMTEANFNQIKPVFIETRDKDKEEKGEYAENERFGLLVKVVQGQGRAMKFRSAGDTENGTVSETNGDNIEVI